MENRTDMNPQVAEVAEWLQEQLDRVRYGDLAVFVTVHDGEPIKTLFQETKKHRPRQGGKHANDRGKK